MMQFEKLKRSIIDNVLVPAEAGRYVTVGYQRQRESADVINGNRQVTVYFSESQMPKSKGQVLGKVMHEVAFKIELSVASSANADLSVLNDENATANERATAIRRLSEAAAIADAEMDDLIRIVYQILRDARNNQLGMTPDPDRPNLKQVSNVWVDQMQKDTPDADGEYILLTGSMRLTCTIEETITGDDLVDFGNKTFNVDIDLDGDDVEKTGVEVTAS